MARNVLRWKDSHTKSLASKCAMLRESVEVEEGADLTLCSYCCFGTHVGLEGIAQWTRDHITIFHL